MSEQPIKLFASLAERYPEPSDADRVQGATRALLAAVPIVGGSITELASMLLTPPLTRRRDEWFKDLACVVERLQAATDGFTIANLVNDDVFISAVVETTRIAVGTHQREKREMLRNALLNIALKTGPHEDLQQLYLNAVQTFSLSHILILKFFWTGTSELQRAGLWDAVQPNNIGTYGDAIVALHPEMKGRDDSLQAIITDLRNRAFTDLRLPSAAFNPRPPITNLGIGFLQFIVEPAK